MNHNFSYLWLFVGCGTWRTSCLMPRSCWVLARRLQWDTSSTSWESNPSSRPHKLCLLLFNSCAHWIQKKLYPFLSTSHHITSFSCLAWNLLIWTSSNFKNFFNPWKFQTRIQTLSLKTSHVKKLDPYFTFKPKFWNYIWFSLWPKSKDLKV